MEKNRNVANEALGLQEMPFWFIPLDFVRIKREDAYERFLSTVKYSINTMYLS